MNTKEDSDYLELLPCNCKIVEVDGVEWVYPNFLTDFSYLKCAVKITDEYENMFYKPGQDDDIIEYLEKNNIPNPTFDYKCELGKFIDEISNTHLVETGNITPVGDYESILESFPFKGFAEYPIDMRLDDLHPYLPKKELDITNFEITSKENGLYVVTILGYLYEETDDDGMVYSYYYVYIEPLENGRSKCYDDTVYIMKAYGSPTHPYYGQRRMEIGDRYIRIETDKSVIREEGILSATKLLYIVFSKENNLLFAFPDFATSFSNVKDLVLNSYKINDGEKQIYTVGRDDDVIDFMKEKNIDPPEYEYKAAVISFIKEINKNVESTK